MRRISLLPILVLLGVAAPAGAAPLPVSGTLDLFDAPPTQTVRWLGTERGAVAGGAVAGVGDFDGDGRRDVAVGEPKRDTAAGADSGAVYVLFDARSGGRLGDAANSVTIRGAQAGDYAGFDVAAAGDVNGDGLADLLVGAPLAGPRGDARIGPGEAYLVFGRAGRAEIDLGGDFGGVRVTGGAPGDWLGRSVASLPDTTGDGRPELVVGAPGRDVGDRVDAGSAFVVFGGGAGEVDVTRAVEDGAAYRLDGPSGTRDGGALAGRAVGSIGDLDGDGRPEVLVTAPQGSAGGPGTVPNGLAYVVLGRATPGVVDLEQLGGQGYVVRGRPDRGTEGGATRGSGDWLGESISGLGDVNGDDLPDFVVGAHLANGPDRARAGVAYVLFGKRDTDPVDVSRLGGGGYRIIGLGAQDQTGFATAPAGDFNADDIPDLAVGAPFADPLSREGAGAVYVVYGRDGTPADVDLAEIGERGIRIAGREQDAVGFALDGAGDVDGDGGPDLALGAVSIDQSYLFNLTSHKPGSASIVFGAAGKPGEIPGEELKADPGYKEAVAEGCRPAINVQAVLDDDDYNDERADPNRIRLTGMQAYVATPRNYGTVLGVTGFSSEEGGLSTPILEPAELSDDRVDLFKRYLKLGVTGEDIFPGYGRMFRTLADDNPSAGGRIMVIDGYTFRSIRRLEGLTDGSAPTYIVAIGEPPDRNRSDIRQMKRVTRETKGRYYEARTARELERALQAIQSRLRCDVEADDYQAELQGDDDEAEIADVELDDDVYSADITLTWRDDDEDYEIEEIDVLDDDGDLVREIDEEDVEEAYEEDEEDEDDFAARAAATRRTRSVTGGRGRTFRALHLRRLRPNQRLRVVVRADNRRSRGRVFARVTQSRNRR